MEPLHDDQGLQVGWVAEAEDGALVALALDGETIVGAADPYSGEPLDPNMYEMGDADPYDAAADLRAELAELQALAAQNREVLTDAVAQVQHDAAAAIDQQRLDADVNQQLAHTEEVLGRRLTVAEMREVGSRLSGFLQAGRQPDMNAALEAMETEGKGLLDLDDRAERVEYMTQRAREIEREQRGEGIAEQIVDPSGARSRDTYNLDDRQQRLDYYADRMSGAISADEAQAVVEQPPQTEA